MAQAFAAPRLTNELLHQHLRASFGADINYTAITQDPCWAMLAPLWERILQTTFNLTREHLKAPIYTALDALSHPDLHDDAIYIRTVFVKMRKIAKMAMLAQFSIKDLCDPGHDRLVEILSNIINLHAFLKERKTEREEQMQSVVEARAVLALELQKKEEQIAELQAMKDNEASEQTEADKLLAKAAACEQAANNNAKQTNAVRQELETAQHKINDLVQHMQQVKAKMQALRVQKDELKECLLPESPDKVAEKLRQQQQEISNMEQSTADCIAKRKQLQKYLYDWETVYDKVQTTVQRMGVTEGKVVAKKQQRAKLKQVLGTIADLQQQAEVLQVELNQLQLKHANVLAKKEKLISEAEAQIQAAEQEVESIKGERELRQHRARTKQTKIAELGKQIEALQQQRRDVEAQCQAEAGSVQKAMDALRDDLLAFRNAIQEAFFQGAQPLPNHAFQGGHHPVRGALADLTNTATELTTGDATAAKAATLY